MALVERLVLENFANPAALTRLDLEDLTGLSRNVVAGVVASLLDRGELVELRQPSAPGTRGRPPARYQRAALLPPVLLIQLGKDDSTTVSLVQSDGSGSKAYDCAPWSSSWQSWSSSVADAAGELQVPGQPPPRLAVLSAPFPVGERRGVPRLNEEAVKGLRLPGNRLPLKSPWLKQDPRPALSEVLECTALMVNDANLAALGEAHFGAGRGRRAVVHVCVVGGVGAGFVFQGRLFTGAHGFSGELAHVQVTPGGQACPCGNHGCLATEILRTGAFFDRGEKLGSLVGRALAPLVTVLDPDCVVIDARLGGDAKPFVAWVSDEIARRCPTELSESAVVLAGELDDAERLGALAAADAHAANSLSL